MGLSNPRNENGSNLQGPDSPISLGDELEVSRNSVTFSDFVRERVYRQDLEAHDVVDDELTAEELRRQRDGYLFGCCPFDADLFVDFLGVQDVVRAITEYETQSGFANPPEFFDDKGVLIPAVFEAREKAYFDYVRDTIQPRFDKGVLVVPNTNFNEVALKFKPAPPAPIPTVPVVPSTPLPRPDRPGKSGENGQGNEPRSYQFQSGKLHDVGETPPKVTQVLTTMHDDTVNVEHHFMNVKDDTYYQADAPDVFIGDYFARPLKIAAYSWTVNTPFPLIQIDPLLLWFTNKRVVNRIATNANFKCDLCVRILVNGTPFHYGLLLASHRPQAVLDYFQTTVPQTGLFMNMSESQLPHVYLDPTTSQGGCLRMSYMGTRNAWNTLNADYVGAHLLTIREITGLRHTSGVVEPITVTVMAWAENMVLSVPTGFNPLGYITQSGDEYGEGVISRPAFILSSLMGRLRDIPLIGPYALATQIGAGAIGNIAKMFGYVKPRLVSDMCIAYRKRNPNFASATQHEPINCLTFDDKAEVTVDPRVAGFAPMDEMVISTIATRESYLTQFNWGASIVPETRLFTIAVSPALYNSVPAGLIAPTQYYMTPSCHVGVPFRYWRGSMRYRFQAVCSSFHRGRLRFVYEPGGLPNVSSGEYNTAYQYVWDLSTSKEAVIEIGWNSESPYLTTHLPGPNIRRFETSAALFPRSGEDNGTLSVYIMNELTAPDVTANSDISIMVCTAACDDIEFFDPSERGMDLYSYTPQSGELIEDTPVKSVATECHAVFGKRCEKRAENTAIFYGDPILSVRTLIKRYCRGERLAVLTLAGTSAIRFNVSSFVYTPGAAPGAVNLSGSVPVNDSHMNFLAWFAPCYLGRRGGMRNRFVPTGNTVSVDNVTAGRSTFGPALLQTTTTVAPAYNTNSVQHSRLQKKFVSIAQIGVSGMTISSDKETLDVEIPYHHPMRYIPTRHPDNTILGGAGIDVRTVVNSTAPLMVAYDRYVAAGDDFTFLCYLNVPPMFGARTYA